MLIPQRILDTFMMQSYHHDCGIACLKSVYGYFGLEQPNDLEEGLNTNGINLLQLKCDAEKHDLWVDAYQFDCKVAPEIYEISLLVVQRNSLAHAVICYPDKRQKQGNDLFLIGDPATGLSWQAYADLNCTGVLLCFKSKSKSTQQIKQKFSIVYQQLLSFRAFTGSFISIISLGLVISLLAIAMPLMIQRKIDEIEAVSEHHFFVFALFIFFIIALKNLLNFLRQKLLADFAKRYHSSHQLVWLNGLSNFKIQLLKTLNNADFIKLLKEQHQRQQGNLLFFTTLFSEFILLVTWILLAAYYSKVIAFMLCGIIGLSQLVLWRNNRKLGANQEKLKEVNVLAEHEFLSYCHGIGYLKVIGFKDRFKSFVAMRYKNLYQEIEQNSLFQTKVQFLSENYNGLILWSTAVLSTYFLITQEFSKGEVLAMIMVAYYLYPTINKLNAVITSYYEQIPNLKKSKLFQENQFEHDVAHDFESLRIIRKTSHYVPSLTQVCHLRKGSFLVITGRNGIGKTTLLESILGIAKQPDYEFCWNENADIKCIKDIGYVPQDVSLFNGSLLYNITLDHEVMEEQIHLFITQFQLQDFFAGFEYGITSLIKNENISGGQKRMIGLLRELYRKPAILFLDEPNVGLDDHYHHWLKQVLQLLKQKMAIVCVTHDLQIELMATEKLEISGASIKQAS
jgi:ABC-type bacteriocin/lantibiotic exporter with double-glycine peptidase domain